MDSIVTSSGNVIFAGDRESVYWGKTSLSTYLTFKTTEDYSQSSSPEYEREYLFDSLTLYLTPDGSFCGDTLKDITLAAYKLSEEVELNDDSELYAHSEFSREETPCARLAFTPRPLRGRAIELRLDDDIGEELLDKVTSYDTEVEDDDNFKEWFPVQGLCGTGVRHPHIQDRHDVHVHSCRIGFPYLNNLRSIKTCCQHKPDIDIEPQRSSAAEEQIRYKQKIIGREAGLRLVLEK